MRMAASKVNVVRGVGVGVIAGYVAVVNWGARMPDYELWAALVFLPLIVLLNVHLVIRATRNDEKWVLRVLLSGLALKGVGALARYLLTYADAGVYHGQGGRLAAAYRSGDFGVDVGTTEFIGTGFIRALTGALYTVTGPSVAIGYAFYALAGFWGLYCFLRAFQVAVPEGEQRRYALLVMLLPSTVFWSSGLGKDAWMTFGLGLMALGIARLLTQRGHWLLSLTAGLAATIMVRPPITAIAFVGLAAALLLRKQPSTGNTLTPLIRLIGLAGTGVVGFFLVNNSIQFLGMSEASLSTAEAIADDRVARTSQGGSRFDAQPIRSPADFPWAAVTVLFRPFLVEAHNATALVAAAEGTLLIVLVILSLGRLRGLLPRLRRQPYLIVCLVFVVVFVYGYSSVSNFGILTRQRVQVLPFLLVFLALPAPSRRPVPVLRPADHPAEPITRGATS